MKKTLKILTLVLVCIISFAAGSIYQWMEIWYRLPVSVNVINHSGNHITNLILTHKSQISGTIVVPYLERGGLIVLKYYPAGEGGFSLSATLENGKVVTGVGGYVEGGYEITKTITDKEISSVLSALGR